MARGTKSVLLRQLYGRDLPRSGRRRGSDWEDSVRRYSTRRRRRRLVQLIPFANCVALGFSGDGEWMTAYAMSPEGRYALVHCHTFRRDRRRLTGVLETYRPQRQDPFAATADALRLTVLQTRDAALALVVGEEPQTDENEARRIHVSVVEAEAEAARHAQLFCVDRLPHFLLRAGPAAHSVLLCTGNRIHVLRAGDHGRRAACSGDLARPLRARVPGHGRWWRALEAGTFSAAASAAASADRTVDVERLLVAVLEHATPDVLLVDYAVRVASAGALGCCGEHVLLAAVARVRCRGISSQASWTHSLVAFGLVLNAGAGRMGGDVVLARCVRPKVAAGVALGAVAASYAAALAGPPERVARADVQEWTNANVLEGTSLARVDNPVYPVGVVP